MGNRLTSSLAAPLVIYLLSWSHCPGIVGIKFKYGVVGS
jgi:hypothetical protein